MAPHLHQPICRDNGTGRSLGRRAPPFRIFAGEFFRQNVFGLIQEYCEVKRGVRSKQANSFTIISPVEGESASGKKAMSMRELAKQDNTKIDVWVNHTEYVKIQIYSRANITITKPKDYK